MVCRSGFLNMDSYRLFSRVVYLGWIERWIERWILM